MKAILIGLVFIVQFSLSTYAQEEQLDIVQQYLLSTGPYDLKIEDLAGWQISHSHVSNTSGAQYLYIQQYWKAIPIDNAILVAVFDKTNNLRFTKSGFVKNTASANTNVQSISRDQALAKAISHLALDISPQIISTEKIEGATQKIIYEIPNLSYDPVDISLVYLYSPKNNLRLHWQVRIVTLDGLHHWIIFVDAQTGRISKKRDLTIHCSFDAECASPTAPSYNAEDQRYKTSGNTLSINPDSYRVYAQPIESPNHGDSTIETNPADATASPFGWHDTDGIAGAEYTITRGNNVYAQEDRDNNNNTFGNAPDGGAGLDFDYAADFSADPTTNPTQNAAITNLFYWNNLIHDVWYHHGFDEAAGNFQENNYGNGGQGSDYVIADAQDAGGQNNANFSTPADGSNPRMQMYLWDPTDPNDPDLDGDFDNGIIVHEYAHGITNRLTGGAGASGCLGNAEQPGEGWSDWFALVMTHESGDTRTTSRGIGTYVLEQDPDTGTGIRTYPYTTDMAVNPDSYNNIIGQAVHRVGSVWCVMLWELYWDLIDQDGFDADLIQGNGGNNKAMKLVMEALKLQPCSPGFVDARDAILEADQLLYGGANRCLIWSAFARRGLGASASQGSSDNTSDGSEGYDVQGATIQKTSDLTEVDVGQTVTYTITTQANCTDSTNFVISDTLPAEMSYVAGSASDGGVHNNGIITWPPIPNYTSGMSTSYTYQATLQNGSFSGNTTIFFDDMESGTANWSISNTTGLSDWVQTSSTDCGSTAWYAEELEANPQHTENQFLDLNATVLDGITTLSFDHSYDTEINWDGGQVEISIDGGNSWTDLGPQFTQNGYNDYIKNSPTDEAFAGNSGGCIQSVVDLTPYCGETVIIRFNFYYDQLVAGNGWYIDNVQLTSSAAVKNVARADLGGGQEITASHCVKVADAALPVQLVDFVAVRNKDHIRLQWKTAQELHNKGFYLERRSAGTDFVRIHWIDAGTDISEIQSYQYEDYDVLPGRLYYYRLQQIDRDEQSTYSNIISAKIRSDNTFKISPNPVRSPVPLHIHSASGTPASIKLLNPGGQVILSAIVSDWPYILETSDLHTGIYILQIQTDQEQLVQKIILH